MAGGLFAFLLSTDRGFSHRIHLVDGNGGSLRRVTNARAIGRPTFSPDGQRIVFPGPLNDDSDGRFCLHVVGVDGSGLRRLTTPLVADLDPAWSPDGSRIAFVRDDRGAMDPAQYHLHTMSAGGGSEVLVSTVQGARDPAWSPEGVRLAFTAFGRLYTVNASGSGLQVLHDGGARMPAWSPDGTIIAFVETISAGQSRLVTMPATGGPLTVRADLGAQVEDPSWGPEDTSLSFLAYRGQGWEGRSDTGIWRVTDSGAAQPVLRLTTSGVRLRFHPDPPPSAPTALTATEVTQRTVHLQWVNPAEPDLAEVEVRMSAGPQPPTSPAEGVLVYRGRAAEALVSEGIHPATAYSFSVFARDLGGNVSAPSSTTVVTPPPGPPDPPEHVEAVPGRESARVSWTPPLNDGGRPLLGYTVVQDGTGETTEVGAGEHSVVVRGLAAGQSHAFSVLARNELGPSAPARSNAVTPDRGAVAGTFVALTPARLVDTRTPPTRVTSAADLVVPVAGRAGVPPGAIAAALTVVATDPLGPGFLAAYPAGTTRPTVSTLNYLARQIVANLDVVRLSDTGAAIGVGGAATHVVVDVAGCYVGSGGPAGGRLNAVTPARVLDTRAPGEAALAGGGTRRLQLAGVGGIPPTGVGSVVLVLTAVTPSASTYLSLYPSATTRPTASVVNAARGETVAVLVFARLGADGKVEIYNHAGATHVVADLLGYHTASAVDPGELYSPLTPARVLDTRSGLGARAGTVGADETVLLAMHRAGGVPSTARTVLLNVTATQPAQATHITVYPAGRRQPDTSVLNVARGRTVANLVLAKLGADGVVALRNAAGSVHLIADVRGYYSA
ncbi:MAG TPA: fibronectin type III domain-containing protein [Mycobacteriales bacterium]|nr:fibronectin type III domain-containing protein [Mycobacteriales bacterium]